MPSSSDTDSAPPRPVSPRQGRRLRGVLVVGSLTLLAVAVWPHVSRWHKQRMINRLAAQASHTPDQTIHVPIRQLAALGRPAVPQLVSFAASQRAAPAYAAQEALSDLFAAWEAEARESSRTAFAPRLATLAAALAQHTDRMNPSAKAWAEGLALRIVEHTDELTPKQNLGVLADCQAVFDAIPPRGPRLRNLAMHDATAAANDGPPPLPRPQADLRVFAAADRPSVGNLPLETAAPAANPPTAEPMEKKATPPPATRIPDTSNNPLRKSNSSAPSSEQPGTNGAPSSPGKDSPVEFAPQPDLPSRRIVDVPTPEAMAAKREHFGSLTLRELFQQLPHAHGFEAATIRDVARMHGITEAELRLAPMLASPDVKQRLQLLDRVVQMPAASSRRWLRWLLEDPAAEVRLQALTMMATTGDPQLLDLAQKRATEDTDPQVAKLAAKILESRR